MRNAICPGLVLLVALGIGAPSGHLVGQESHGHEPIDELLTFVREKARVAVRPEQRPYDPARVFLMVGPRVSEPTALGSLDDRNLERLGVTLVDDKADALVFDSVAGAYVRDDGVYVVISSADRVDRGALAIAFSYFVTWRRPGRRTSLCLEEWRIVLRRADGRDGGWRTVETDNRGAC